MQPALRARSANQSEIGILSQTKYYVLRPELGFNALY